jgi:hypothetical protein
MYGKEGTEVIYNRSQVIRVMIKKIRPLEKSAERGGQKKVKGLVPLVIVSSTAPY